ncbi:MAG: retropepsin-like aspartic protease [Nocardioides sp.]
MAHTLSYEPVDHFVRVAATLGGRPGRFLVDSGIGLTVVATSTAESVGAVALERTFTGRRMSGQEVSVPLVRLPVLEVAGLAFRDHLAGVVDLGPTDGDRGFDGVLGLDLFVDLALTVDPDARTVTLAEAAPDGLDVPVEVERDGPSVATYTRLVLPSGRVVRVEVDTGSGSLILDDVLMSDCDVEPEAAGIDVRTGTDETGHEYVRRFVTIAGSVQIDGVPATAQARPRVQFQRIRYDGLVGTDFLNRFRQTFDVRGSRLVLEPLAR